MMRFTTPHPSGFLLSLLFSRAVNLLLAKDVGGDQGAVDVVLGNQHHRGNHGWNFAEAIIDHRKA